LLDSIRKLKNWSDGVDDLKHEPGGDNVGSGYAKDAATLELLKKGNNCSFE
jgi:hypothetical protein